MSIKQITVLYKQTKEEKKNKNYITGSVLNQQIHSLLHTNTTTHTNRNKTRGNVTKKQEVLSVP